MGSQPVIGIQRVLIRAACLSSLPSYSGAASPEAEHLTGTHSHEKRRRKRRGQGQELAIATAAAAVGATAAAGGWVDW